MDKIYVKFGERTVPRDCLECAFFRKHKSGMFCAVLLTSCCQAYLQQFDPLLGRCGMFNYRRAHDE